MHIMQMSTMQIIVGSCSNICFHCKIIYDKSNNLLEYSVEPMIIDPFNSTPPDKFINCLTNRMKKYYNDLSEKKSWNIFGFSPYKWMRIDLSSIYKTSALTFKLKATELPKIQAFLFAYTGKKRRLQKILNESNFINKGNNIYEAYIPLKSLIDYREFRWDELKEIRFKILDGTQFEIGDFQIIEFRGNPKKPTEWKGI